MNIEVTILDNTVYVVTDDTGRVTFTTQDNSRGQAGIQWEDEGVVLGTKGTVDRVNFVGSGVSVARNGDGLTVTVSSGGGSGDVVGPSGATNNNIAVFDTATGKLIKDGGTTVAALQAATTAKLSPSAAPFVDLSFAKSAASIVLTNQPNTEEYFLAANQRTVQKFDTTNFGFVRVMVNIVTGSASANIPRMYPKFKTTYTNGDAVGTFTTVGAGTVASGDAISLTTAGIVVSNWITLPAGALADVFWAIASHGGDGVLDPAIGSISLQFKIA